MDQKAAAIAANELPDGAQIVFSDYPEGGKFYSCTYHHDVVYAQYGGIERRLQIIQPRWGDYRFPLVVHIMGSAWGRQRIYEPVPSLSYIASKGYVIASVEIRESEIAPFPAALEDVKCALRFMRENAVKYGVNPEKAAVWGDSSGGHLALMTGLTMGEYNNGLYGEQSDAVSAVVDYYGVSDIPSLGRYNDILDHDAADSPEGLLLGGRVTERMELAKKASPIHQDLDKALPPFLIIHGDSDGVVHVSQSIELYKVLKQHNQKAIFYKVIGADHGPGIWTPRILDLTEAFLSAHLNRR